MTYLQWHRKAPFYINVYLPQVGTRSRILLLVRKPQLQLMLISSSKENRVQKFNRIGITCSLFSLANFYIKVSFHKRVGVNLNNKGYKGIHHR
jgi:hypothetical protein